MPTTTHDLLNVSLASILGTLCVRQSKLSNQNARKSSSKKNNMAACKGVIDQLIAKRFTNLRVSPELLRTNRHEIYVKVYNC